MNEIQTKEGVKLRPTKKQKELLSFIEVFIKEHGYSPSFREIMRGLNYTSVATVALHVNSLVKRGHLIKRDHSARSLEVVNPLEISATKITTNLISESQEKWLVEKVEHLFKEAEITTGEEREKLDNDIRCLIKALLVLGMDGAANSFIARLSNLNSTPEAQRV